MFKYTIHELNSLAVNTSFLRDNLEKVLRLCDVLLYINTNPLLSVNLALKGGTAINLIVFNLPRLSVDIDLDFTKKCTRDEMFALRKLINADIMKYMISQGYLLNPSSKTPHSLDSWVFFYQNTVGNSDNIKIEVNYSMRNHIFEPSIVEINILSLSKFMHVRTLNKFELFGSKIKALIERTAARDLYDVYNMLKQGVVSDSEQVMLRKVVVFYLAIGGNKPPQSVYSLHSIDNLNHNQIKRRLIPVLKKTDKFDFETAKSEVKKYLHDLLIFTEDELRFIEKFNQQEYHPEFLFDNPEIIERIKDHPMALWKCDSN